jgi:hypothetical protein
MNTYNVEMNKKGASKTSHTYHWWNPSDGSNQEQNNSLTKQKHMGGLNGHSQ